MIISIFMLVIGLATLLAAAHVIIPGTVSIANYLQIPAHVVAVLLIAAGTSAPELVVALQAALNDAPQIVWGNIIGSNITNILVVLGIIGLMFPINTGEAATTRDMTLLLVITALICIPAYYFNSLPLLCGLALVIILAIYTIYLVSQRSDEYEINKNIEKELSFNRSLIYCFAGIAGLIFGAEILIRGAVELAIGLSISKTVIGLTIIAFGTSLPEIAAAVASLFHRRVDMALGSIIGSNIFNIAAGLGITRLVSELEVPIDMLLSGMPVMILVTIMLAVIIVMKLPIGRVISICFLSIYCLFLWINMMIGS